MKQQIHFFIGKGGVGKSTVSALSALHAAKFGNDTLLISLDPAHNQKDIFRKNFSGTPERVSENLHVVEPDIDQWVRKYLQESEEKLQANYRYQQAFSLKNYFKVFKYSPAVEEYAMLLAFSHYLEEFKHKHQILVDMPPSALSLRFFALPGLSLKWLEQLKELRLAINAKKEIISKLKFGNKEIETDKVMLQLQKLDKSYSDFRMLFNSTDTQINIVANPEELSINEAVRVYHKMKDIDLNISKLILNKVSSAMDDMIEIPLKELKVSKFKLSAQKLIGLENLNAYLDQYGMD